jgi:hypothetical protein
MLKISRQCPVWFIPALKSICNLVRKPYPHHLLSKYIDVTLSIPFLPPLFPSILHFSLYILYFPFSIYVFFIFPPNDIGRYSPFRGEGVFPIYKPPHVPSPSSFCEQERKMTDWLLQMVEELKAERSAKVEIRLIPPHLFLS